ncbi:flagellar basal-body MS-ring/collar protein FliF [Marinilactibacillus kalidii]|uniref:flagellar basal-body MS-ring/collar protein FliF n=1 Tax=Marinilactibacillus kalidii TaxID=2820274 RepID=UPI001ABDB324|nr:flagellar basal-body MS-ring/collar protein FliF [Marinilactibacillus kalidii]
MDKFKDIWGSLRSGWINLEASKRKKLIAIVIAASIILAILGYLSQRKQYTVLFSNLEEADAGAIVENLETEGILYKLEDGGTTILIDEKMVDQYRLEVATTGLMPQSSTGFEIFDDTNMMATDQDREIMYQRAVTGELERSISSIQQVESAKVMLSIPEESIFQNPEYESEASASIVLQTRGASQLTTQNIQGIASLVSGAVDNLPVSNIQIIDANGNLLSGFLQDSENAIGATDISNQQLSVQKSYEDDLEKRINELLAPVYGANNIRVVVNAAMNFDAVEGETVTYTAPMIDPDSDEDPEREGLIRSQTENYNGANDMLQGLIEEGQLPVADDADAEDGQNASYDRTINYELDQNTERYVRAPGVVEAIDASIVINQTGDAVIAQNQLVPIVRRALGLDSQVDTIVGDVTIEAMAFAGNEEIPAIGEGDFMEETMIFFKRYWPFMIGSIILLILGIAILSILKRGRKDEFDEFDPVYETQTTAEQPVKLEPVEPAPVDLNIERKKQQNKVMSDKEDLVREEAKQNPELAAELMKIWLKE